MTTFVDGPVRVSVPATSANLGPGFDSLGLALSMRDELEAEVTGSGLVVEVTGAGADDVPRDESHLVVRSMRAAFDADGRPAARAAARVHQRRSRTPAASARPRRRSSPGSCSPAALVAGRHAAARRRRRCSALAARIEGHPDNVAPAFFGGFAISGRDEDGEFYAVGSPVDPRIEVVVFVPPDPVSTEVARGLLPAEVPHADAAADAGRTALLVAALAGQPEHLLRATRDYLHQELPAAGDAGVARRWSTRCAPTASPAIVSGAGPTVLAFTDAAGARRPLAGAAARTGWVAPPASQVDTRRAPRLVADGRCILTTCAGALGVAPADGVSLGACARTLPRALRAVSCRIQSPTPRPRAPEPGEEAMTRRRRPRAGSALIRGKDLT